MMRCYIGKNSGKRSYPERIMQWNSYGVLTHRVA
jgi:hypothetical protein